ncbi:MAG TPA: hypothetical protein VFK35_05095 [Candidatus Limnocylindrales bacterium]|nr:hypothetical protein [Candidatus Limnocylindrales bacterium]
MTAPGRRAGAALAAVLFVGCGTALPSGRAGPTTSPAALSPPASSSAPASAPVSLAPVIPDPALLDLLPIGADGLILTYDPDTTARIAADPALAADAASLAVGLATLGRAQGLRTPDPLGDLAVVSVVRLRDPASDEEWFRDWRDTYDTAACAQAGGVARHAESAINGRTVFIGSCAGGAFTYHVRTADGATVLSVTSVGTARVGEAILRRLAPAATIAP